MEHFSRLIYPITSKDFFDNYYEKKPLLLHRKDTEYYNHLLSLKAVDEYLSRQDIQYPGLRLVKDGKELEGSIYLKDVPYGRVKFEGVIDNDSMFKLFNDGATIVIQGFDRSNTELGNFCRSISTEIPFTFQPNIYLTPVKSQGFSPHYDTHDVICLQISGTKKWKLYNTPVELPTNQQRYQPSEDELDGNLPVSLEFELSPGDLLYIPRGLVHSAETSETASLHITLGLHPQKWSNYIKYLVGQLHNNKLFREALPLNFKNGTYDYDLMINKVGELITKGFTKEFLEKFTSSYAIDQIQEKKSSNSHRLFDILNIEQLNMSTKIYRRLDIVFNIVTTNELVEIIFYTKKLKFPIVANEALKYILNQKEFTPTDIPNSLDNKGKLVVVKMLIKEGLLTFENN